MGAAPPAARICWLELRCRKPQRWPGRCTAPLKRLPPCCPLLLLLQDQFTAGFGEELGHALCAAGALGEGCPFGGLPPVPQVGPRCSLGTAWGGEGVQAAWPSKGRSGGVRGGIRSSALGGRGVQSCDAQPAASAAALWPLASVAPCY